MIVTIINKKHQSCWNEINYDQYHYVISWLTNLPYHNTNFIIFQINTRKIRKYNSILCLFLLLHHHRRIRWWWRWCSLLFFIMIIESNRMRGDNTYIVLNSFVIDDSICWVCWWLYAYINDREICINDDRWRQ